MESDLPLELLTRILSYLDPMSRVSAGLVCKRWLNASAELLEDVNFIIRGQPPTLMTGRMFPRITFNMTDINDDCIDFINNPRMLHLRFNSCMASTKKKAVACTDLRTLQTDSGDVLLVFASLPHLKELYVEHAYNIRDKMLMAFDKIASSKLEVFGMPSPAGFQIPVGMEFFPGGFTLKSPHILSAEALEKFVARRAETLTTVSLPRHITTGAALSLSRIDGLKLRSVSFSHCSIKPNNIIEFCRNQPGIVILNLDYAKTSLKKDEHVAEICKLLPALREFSAAGCNLSDSSPLLCLQHLRKLCLSGNCYFNVASFIRDIPQYPLIELQILDLSHTQIHNKHMCILFSHTPRLVELYLSGSNVSDYTLIHLGNVLTQLRTLVLKGCEGLSENGLQEIRKLQWLKRLELP